MQGFSKKNNTQLILILDGLKEIYACFEPNNRIKDMHDNFFTGISYELNEYVGTCVNNVDAFLANKLNTTNPNMPRDVLGLYTNPDAKVLIDLFKLGQTDLIFLHSKYIDSMKCDDDKIKKIILG